MSNDEPLTDWLGVDLDRLRRDLRHDTSDGMTRRRRIIALSLLGMGSMAAVSLLQTGLARHLSDPPLPGFDSDKVNLSDDAYQMGVPDGTLSLLGLAANLPLAAFGEAGRARRRPWVPLAAALKSGAEALGAGYYFYQMPAEEDAWCGYCILGALVNAGLFALTLPEAREALTVLRSTA